MRRSAARLAEPADKALLYQQMTGTPVYYCPMAKNIAPEAAVEDGNDLIFRKGLRDDSCD
jgi:hypothetical protein